MQQIGIAGALLDVAVLVATDEGPTRVWEVRYADGKGSHGRRAGLSGASPVALTGRKSDDGPLDCFLTFSFVSGRHGTVLWHRRSGPPYHRLTSGTERPASGAARTRTRDRS